MRHELPTGTVTFLFTDIEGSTRLLHEFGAEGYGAALAEHRRVLRQAFARHGGVEVDTQGDAFFVAFARASDAMAVALEAQAALEGEAIRVRMGLHTGEPTVTAEGYVGVDVHKGARIAAAGHGGQILVSEQTARLGDGFALVDLGEHRLKDLSAPERIFQLGAGEFPPLKTLYRTNLPSPPTPFLGRRRELEEVTELLARDEVRLLTLTGAGGTGKTRLALQAAAARADGYPGGVVWTPLAPLRDARVVAATVAQALGGQGSLVEQVGDQRLLLLLDNFEHVLSAASEVSQLLGQCPNVDVLVTSRELLQLSAEHVYPVPSLANPEAVELFNVRAQAVRPGFAADQSVTELCARLDNLPLAIELAAAHIRVLSVEELRERLTQRLDFLKAGRDADPRQATLRATIEWSHGLLDEEERRVFASLAAFAGGCTLEAAEHVCEADTQTLVSLVDKSLLRRRADGRLWMLETIRELAAERLEESGDSQDVRARHARYFSDLAQRLGLSMESLEAGHAQRHDLAIPELDNFRAALDFAERVNPVLGLRLAASLENLWVTQVPQEGMRWLERLLAQAEDAPLSLRAAGIRSIGSSATLAGGDFAVAARRYAESLELYERAGDDWGIAVLEHRLGVTAFQLDQWSRSRLLLERSLARARRHGFATVAGMLLGSLATVERHEGNPERALELTCESARLSGQMGFSWWEMNMLERAGDLAAELGRPHEAEEHERGALVLAGRIDDRMNVVDGLASFARRAARRGDVERAGRLWGAVEREEEQGLLPPLWQRERDDVSEALEGAAGEDFERGRTAGRHLSRGEAIAEALTDA